jgi:basic amino acid/polyamine antiporter, APA family
VNEKSHEKGTLARKIGLPLLTFYGLGTILGAGIYVLVGEVAASAGMLAPLAFLVAAIVAGVTAMSYCQLVMHYPKSSGEAYYVQESFASPWLSTLVGYMVILTGVVSTATLANGFVGYLGSFVTVPYTLSIIAVVIGMGTIAIWGIAESLWLAAVITIIEILGLAIVIFIGGDAVFSSEIEPSKLWIPGSFNELSLVFAGAFLAFFAFIGFEDMVNIAEEVKEPKVTMPKAIIIAVLASTALYILVAMVAVFGLPLAELSNSDAPLRDLVEQSNASAGKWIGAISLFAIVNGVLTQSIMASRVLYGMAQQGRAPSVFGRVSDYTRTPIFATIAIISLVLLFSLWLPLVTLAKATSFVVLGVFTLVNLALWNLHRSARIKRSSRPPAWPLLGALLCVSLLILQIIESF